MSTDLKTIVDEQLVYPQEKVLFIVSAIFSSLIWILLVVGTFGAGLIFIGFFALLFLILKQLFTARIKGFGIRVSENQYPVIYAQLKRISTEMSLPQIPTLYVLQMEGVLNAFAMNIFSRNFVVITTATLDACADDEDALAFIIAHEVTHHTKKHTKRIGFLSPSRILPWLGRAYSRACEYTADAYGAKYGATSVEKAMHGISILATASIARSRSLHVADYLNQARDVANFWSAVANTNSSHPFTTLRYARISSLASGKPSHPRSNFFGFLLAPFFSLYMILILYVVLIALTSME